MTKTAFNLDRHKESLGFKLWFSANNWQTVVRKKLAKLDLSPLEIIILSTLYDLITTHGEATQEQIAKLAKLNKMTVSKCLRAMEKKHLLHRKEHEIDTRAKSVTINNNGIYALKTALSVVETVDNDFFSLSSKLLAELEEILSLLN